MPGASRPGHARGPGVRGGGTRARHGASQLAPASLLRPRPVRAHGSAKRAALGWSVDPDPEGKASDAAWRETWEAAGEARSPRPGH